MSGTSPTASDHRTSEVDQVLHRYQIRIEERLARGGMGETLPRI